MMQNYSQKIYTDMEDYVTFEQAKKLKELGFNWKCFYFYEPNKILRGSAIETGNESWIVETDDFKENWNHFDGTSISAPTLAQAQKWLFETHNLFIEVTYDGHGFGWYIYKDNIDNSWSDDNVDYDKPEYALWDGIDAALELLK